MRLRRPRFPTEMLAEAARYPNGHVYEIDERYDEEDAVPSHAIRRGWKVDGRGSPTGEYTDNPSFGVRRPLRDVEQILADARALAGQERLELLVSNELMVSGQQVPFDVGISIVVDRTLALGYSPDPDGWRTDVADGFSYRWTLGGVARSALPHASASPAAARASTISA